MSSSETRLGLSDMHDTIMSTVGGQLYAINVDKLKMYILIIIIVYHERLSHLVGKGIAHGSSETKVTHVHFERL